MPKLIATVPTTATVLDKYNEVYAGVELPVGGILKFDSITKIDGVNAYIVKPHDRCVHVTSGNFEIQD